MTPGKFCSMSLASDCLCALPSWDKEERGGMDIVHVHLK